MKALMLVRWLGVKWASQPWIWAVVCLLAALWPATQVLAPFGMASTQGASHDLVYEVAFVAASIGAACALDALEVLPACSYALGVRPGWPAEWLALTAGCIAVQLAALSIPLFAFGPSDVHFVIETASRVSLSAAYLAAVGVLLLRTPLPIGSRAPAILVLTWITPALVRASLPASLLGVAWPASNDPSSLRLFVASRLACIFALLLCAYLMDAHRKQRT